MPQLQETLQHIQKEGKKERDRNFISTALLEVHFGHYGEVKQEKNAVST